MHWVPTVTVAATVVVSGQRMDAGTGCEACLTAPVECSVCSEGEVAVREVRTADSSCGVQVRLFDVCRNGCCHALLVLLIRLIVLKVGLICHVRCNLQPLIFGSAERYCGRHLRTPRVGHIPCHWMCNNKHHLNQGCKTKPLTTFIVLEKPSPGAAYHMHLSCPVHVCHKCGYC